MSLTNAQYDTILHQYEIKQLKSRREAERRLACVYDRIPGYRDLEDMVAAVTNKFNQFTQNSYDFDALEQELISN